MNNINRSTHFNIKNNRHVAQLHRLRNLTKSVPVNTVNKINMSGEIFTIPKKIDAKVDSSVSPPQLIPKKIFQTWKSTSIPKEMYTTMMNNIELNPDYEYYFFDDNDCRNFIEEHFSTDVLNAYDTLVPGAFKADLWRYCVMYIHGGVYIDCKQIYFVPFSGVDGIIAETDEVAICTDRPQGYLFNAFLASVPHSNLFRHLIDRCVENVNRQYYGRNPIDITGPGMMGELFNTLMGRKIDHAYDEQEYIIDATNVRDSYAIGTWD